ncbi:MULTISPECIES: phage major capsid protein [Exiguobacterium]|uniref:phage major capsid protein n=1 Tax=Exiguobacterium TaxID=33986 RepID=UPI001AE10200|nr:MULTISPECIES: phage major capsid protein [Exiguobacterium]MCT4779831.1 hypothetical protein [Exiguobacterium soli]
MNNNEMLADLEAIKKANSSVTLPEDVGRAYMQDVVAQGTTLAKLFIYPATAPVGTIDMIGIKKRNLKEHLGLDTEPTGSDLTEERSVPFTLKPVYTDTWLKNSDVYYTARSRGQNIETIITSMIQQQFGADLQDLAFNGDEDSADLFEKLQDGFLKLARENADTVKHDVTGVVKVADLQKVPVKVAREQLRAGRFVWIMGAGTHAALQAEVMERETPKGDAVLIDGELSKLHGYAIELVDHIEDDVVLFTPLENLAVVTGFNVQYDRSGTSERAVAKQATYHFVLSSIDFIIRTPKALVYIGADAVTP